MLQSNFICSSFLNLTVKKWKLVNMCQIYRKKNVVYFLRHCLVNNFF